jgi:serine/threonine-protein phosphatase CPPED1
MTLSLVRKLRGVAVFAACACSAPLAAAQIESVRGNAPAATARPVRDDAQRFRFAILADRTGGARPGVFERAIDQLNLLQPDFVVSVGDLIEGYTTDRQVLSRQWSEVDGLLNRLEMRFYYVSGNHDLSNPTMAETWKRRSGHSYYAFRHKDVLFLVLDTDDPPASSLDTLSRLFPEPGRAAEIERLLKTDPRHANELISERIQKLNIPIEELTPASLSERQASWAQQVLAANRNARWTVVLLHKPAWLYKNSENKFPMIQAALAGRRYTVFAGHEHYYQHDVIDGHDYVRLGTTGGEWIRKGSGAVDHVTWVTMTADGPRIANIRIDGVFGKAGPQEERISK